MMKMIVYGFTDYPINEYSMSLLSPIIHWLITAKIFSV